MNATANGAPPVDYALRYLRGGLSPVPIKTDGTKASTINWGALQESACSEDDARLWFAGRVGVAIAYGKASGNAECIDLDGAEIASRYREALEATSPGLLKKLCIIQTPRPGYHLIFRCEIIGGNQKLAKDEEGETLIETRGQGGYALAPGSPPECHETGRTYEHVAGPPLTDLPTITIEERKTLFDVARTFNRFFEGEPSNPCAARRREEFGPGDDFSQRATWEEILSPAGWVAVHKSGDVTHWRRPGKTKGTSATTGLRSQHGSELFCVFSSNAHPFSGPQHGKPCSAHNKFDAYARLNFNGDHSACAKHLAGRGFGKSPQPRAKMPEADKGKSTELEKEAKARESIRKSTPEKIPESEKGESRHEAASIVNVNPRYVSDRAIRETDLGNARRLVNHFGAQLRYVGSWQKWLAWDGTRWRLDDTGAVDRFAQETVRRIFDEARDEKDDARSNNLAKWAIASQSRGKLDAMIAIAASQPEVVITHEQLNTHPHLLNCKNGTVNLRTGELLPHNPAHLITQSTGVEYPSDALAPELWLDVLDTIFAGDAPMVAFLQRLFGLALLGEVVEHILPLFHGDGANGKTLVVEAVSGTMGDYAIKAPRDFCIASKHEQHPTQIADLYGKRLVVVTETGDGQRLDEALVKELTGGDTLRARRMREDFWEFKPSHLALMVTNHRPAVRGVDNGIWRRLKLVPFNVVIPEAEQDPELPRKLRAEYPLILRWMVQGYLDYQRGGLLPPEAVQIATTEYRGSMDSFMQFIDERCTLNASYNVKSSALLHNYRAWCDEQGISAISGQLFGKRMRSLPGVDRYRSNGIVYMGVGLDGD